MAAIDITRQRESVLSQHEVRPGSTSLGAEQQCDTLGVTAGRDRQPIQSSDVEACRDCSDASRRDSSEPGPSTSVSDQYRKSIDRIYRSTDREIWSGEIQSSDGGVESRRASVDELAAVDALLVRADEYRHPDFDSDVEMLVVELADALANYKIERLDRLASSGRRG